MEAQTLQALETFIHTQRELLDRQRADIHKLTRLRLRLVEKPAQILSNLSNELDDPAFRLSEQADCRLALPKDIHWSAFEKSDTTALRTFALTQNKRTSHPSNGCPPTTQLPTPTLSDLQKLVKSARRAIVDPVLEQFQDMSPEPEPAPCSAAASQSDPAEARRRALEREKIRDLRERMFQRGNCGLSVRLSSAVTPGDEGMDVDVDVVHDDEIAVAGATAAGLVNVDKRAPPVSPHFAARNAPAKPTEAKAEAEDGACASMPPPPPPSPLRIRIRIPPSADTQTGKKRKASASPETTPDSALGSGSASERDQNQTDPHGDEEDDERDSSPSHEYRPSKSSKLSKSGRPSKNAKANKVKAKSKSSNKPSRLLKEPKEPKPKPETYKQAWSVSEQNLLEQLLEEVRDGERNRWQKISQAMGGRRTPRQIASRVQKYLEKLRKFGVDVDR